VRRNEIEYEQETSLPMAKVLSRLEDVKRLGPGYYEATCPLDECRSKRLLVIEGEDDRALIECDDGCWLYEIVPALGLTVEDLFNCIDDIYIGTTDPKHQPPESLRADRLLNEDPLTTGDRGGVI